MTAIRKYRQALVLLGSLFLAFAIPALLHRSNLTTSFAEDVIIGAALFSALLLVEVSFLAQEVADRERKDQELWLLTDECDTQLLNISRSFIRLTRESYGPQDLFVAHFRGEIRALSEQIAAVTERRELRIQADHFLTVDNVLDVFQGVTERIWRYAWIIDDDGPLFDDEALAWKRYFATTAAMVEKGEIKEVRTILVVTNPHGSQPLRLTKLLDFYRTNKNLGCCLLSADDFRRLCNQNSVPGSYRDFGLYSDRLLFLTEQDEPTVQGVFTKDPRRIQHYCHLFDSMWQSPSVSRPNPSTATTRVSLDDLFAFDRTPQT